MDGLLPAKQGIFKSLMRLIAAVIELLNVMKEKKNFGMTPMHVSRSHAPHSFDLKCPLT